MAAPLLHLIAGARPNFMKLAPLLRLSHSRYMYPVLLTPKLAQLTVSAFAFDKSMSCCTDSAGNAGCATRALSKNPVCTTAAKSRSTS